MPMYHVTSTICAASAVGLLVIADAVYSQDVVPKGWLHRGNQPESYEMTVDKTVIHSGSGSARIRFIGPKTEGFGSLMQIFKANKFQRKRLRLSAWMKTEEADAAQLWMRMDGPSTVLAFDHMDNRRVTGTTQWRRYEVVLDVPAETQKIAFGALVQGRGTAWVDDFDVEVVGKDVRPTARARVLGPIPAYTLLEFPDEPRNLSFEE